ncbi:MAG: AAA family ATPase [Acidimicrobiia bacterium]|nr:AAA family ATPase [Acidimicrobiia bacterium]
MTTGSEYDDALAIERATNEHYQRCLAEANAPRTPNGGEIAAPANTIWTGAGKPKPLKPNTDGYLVGRVSFDVARDDLGYLRDYYVGTAHCACGDSMLIVSWAAELAKPLYLGTGWNPGASMDARYRPNPRALRAVRKFAHRVRRLIDFEDVLEPGVPQCSAFPQAAAAPTVPPPPPRHSKPPATVPRVETEPPESSSDPEERPGDPAPVGPDPEVRAIADSGDEPVPPTDGLRGSRLVLASLEAPRSDRLRAVLATLQPDQYRYVTWHAAEHLAVRGHPGTGKTIIAAHRAAWLTHPEHDERQTGHRRLGSVALIGPTDEWGAHVSGVLAESGATGVDVLSLEAIVRKLARERKLPLHRDDQQYFETDWEIGRTAHRTVEVLGPRLSKLTSEKDRRELTFNKIVQNASDAGNPEDSERNTWLREARDFENALKDPSYVLLRACIGLLTEESRSFRRYQHIIVDEVQDVRGAEWWIVDKLLNDGGTYSLFGDMNQRRADFTWESWSVLLDRLELSNPDESPLEVMALATGFRSNVKILNYAARLLPKSERTVSALRLGDESSVDCQRVGSTQVIPRAFERARALTEEFSEGYAAVIGWNPQDLDAIRQRFYECGWRQSHSGNRILELTPATGPRKPQQRVMLARPVDARGLEFDGVVVVEPADFKKNLGRHGSLYTSLTRANKKLVVVHSKPLPEKLRGRA